MWKMIRFFDDQERLMAASRPPNTSVKECKGLILINCDYNFSDFITNALESS